MKRMNRFSTGYGAIVAIAASVASTVYGLWFTWVIAFGGQLPPPFETTYSMGSLGLGLLVFLFGIPLIDLIAYWCGMLLYAVVALPVSFVSAMWAARRGRQSA